MFSTAFFDRCREMAFLLPETIREVDGLTTVRALWHPYGCE